jgi:hypothetical protein
MGAAKCALEILDRPIQNDPSLKIPWGRSSLDRRNLIPIEFVAPWKKPKPWRLIEFEGVFNFLFGYCEARLV